MKLKIEYLIFIAFNLIVLGLIFIVSIHTINFAQINPDGSYYLSYSENIFKGYRPYTDMGLDYMPMVIFIFLFFKTLFNNIQYEHYLGIQIISYFIAAQLIYLIVLHFSSHKRILPITAALLFIGAIFTYDGIYIILEPYLIIFALLTILLLLKAEKNNNFIMIFFAGFFSIFCLLCKQYGILIYPSIALYFMLIYLKLKIKINFIGYFLLGILTALLFFLLYMFYIQDITPSSFIYSIFKSKYVKTYPNLSYDSLIYFIKYSVIYVFPVILMLPLLFLIKKNNYFHQFLLILATAFSFFSVMIIRQYPHYFQLALPFIVISIFILLQQTSDYTKPIIKQFRLYHICLFMVFCTMYFIIIRLNQLNDYLIESKTIKETQLFNASIINEIIAARSPTTNLSASLSYSYLCDLIPPDFKESGFNFYLKNEQGNADKTFDQIDHRIKPNIINSTYILTDTLTDISFPKVTEFIKQQQFKPLKTTANGLCIWGKKQAIKD